MPSNLVIVESPAKAKTIEKFLSFSDEQDPDPLTLEPDTRSGLDFIVDKNVFKASDRTLLNPRIRNLIQLGLDVRVSPLRPWTDTVLQDKYSALDINKRRERESCVAWHFSFNRLIGLAFEKKSNTVRKKELINLWKTMLSIETDFKLVSKNEKDSKKLQEKIEEVAMILVEDYKEKTQNSICKGKEHKSIPDLKFDIDQNIVNKLTSIEDLENYFKREKKVNSTATQQNQRETGKNVVNKPPKEKIDGLAKNLVSHYLETVRGFQKCVPEEFDALPKTSTSSSSPSNT